MDEARSVRDFWFGKLPLTAAALNRRMRFWFGNEGVQERRRARSACASRRCSSAPRAGSWHAWADGPRRRLSLVILLDQFPRHIFRGTARAFDYDAQALGLTLSGMQSAADAALDVVERIFFYMPLQHAESDRGAGGVGGRLPAAAHRGAAASCAPVFAGALRSAENHRAIVERFGRFPHRNRLLQRPNTPAEDAWLRRGGESFGQ